MSYRQLDPDSYIQQQSEIVASVKIIDGSRARFESEADRFRSILRSSLNAGKLPPPLPRTIYRPSLLNSLGAPTPPHHRVSAPYALSDVSFLVNDSTAAVGDATRSAAVALQDESALTAVRISGSLTIRPEDEVSAVVVSSVGDVSFGLSHRGTVLVPQTEFNGSRTFLFPTTDADSLTVSGSGMLSTLALRSLEWKGDRGQSTFVVPVFDIESFIVVADMNVLRDTFPGSDFGVAFVVRSIDATFPSQHLYAEVNSGRIISERARINPSRLSDSVHPVFTSADRVLLDVLVSLSGVSLSNIRVDTIPR